MMPDEDLDGFIQVVVDTTDDSELRNLGKVLLSYLTPLRSPGFPGHPLCDVWLDAFRRSELKFMARAQKVVEDFSPFPDTYPEELDGES